MTFDEYVQVPVEGDYIVRNGKFVKIQNLSVQVNGLGVPHTLGFNATGWVYLDEYVEGCK